MIKMRCLFQVLFMLVFPLMGIAQGSLNKDTSVLNKKGRILLGEKVEAKTYQEKAVLLKEALGYFVEAQNWEMVVQSKSDLALQYIFLEDQKAFDEVIKELNALLKKYTVSDDVNSFAKEILVWNSQQKEDYETSEQIYKELFDFALKKSDPIRASRSANNLGFFYMSYISDYERAIDYYQKAIQILRDSKVKNDSQLALLISNLGHCYYVSGFDKLAVENLNRSLSILELEDDQDINLQTKWWNYQNLANYYLSNSSYDSCFYYGNLALDFLEQRGKVYLDDFQTYFTLGAYYLEKGQIDKGFLFYQKGLKLARLKADVFRPTNALVEFADALSKNQNNNAALDSLQLGIQFLCPDFKDGDIFKNPSPSSFIHKKSGLKLIEKRAEVFYKKFKMEKDVKSLKASFSNYHLACDLISLIRQDYVGDISKYFLAENVLDVYESAINIAYEIYSLTGDDQFIEEAFHVAEQNKSVLLLESIKENTAKGFGYLPDTILQEEKELKLNIALLEKKVYEESKATKNIDQLKKMKDELFFLKEKYNNFISSLEKKYPKYFELKYRIPIANIKQLQEEIIDNKTTLLEYFVGEENVFLFCIQKNKVGFLKIEKPENIESDFNQLRDIISKPPQSDQYLEDLKHFNLLASKLYDLLLREALEIFKSDHLIIIPDDFLIYLPFEILLLKNNALKSFSIKDQAYLFKDIDISYSFSSSLLLDMNDVFYKTKKSFVGFAPEFENPLMQKSRACADNELYSLQCSEQEVEVINALFDGEVYKAQQASKSNFESIANGCQIIHLATHACIDESNPNFSRVYFTDDFLSNYDLANMEIRSNLAVLSACNTNVGPLMKGDGVASISKGFLLAGCPSVLTSLWSVDDCSTSKIMISFYENLKKGDTKSAALRKAKTEYLLQVDNVNAHPYYWAPFLLSGNDHAIIMGDNWSNIWYWVFGFLVLVVGILFFKLKNQNTSI